MSRKWLFISGWSLLGAIASVLSIAMISLLVPNLGQNVGSFTSNFASGLLFGICQYLVIRNYFSRSYYWIALTLMGYTFGYIVGNFIFKFSLPYSYFLSSFLISFVPSLFLLGKSKQLHILLWIFVYYLFLVLTPSLFGKLIALSFVESVLLNAFFYFLAFQFVLGLVFYKLFINNYLERAAR